LRSNLQENGKYGGREGGTQENDQHDKPSPAFPFYITRPEDDQADHCDAEMKKTERYQEVVYPDTGTHF